MSVDPRPADPRSPSAAKERAATAVRETVSCPPLTRAEVGRIVNAAKALIEAHAKRSPTSEHSTLNEDAALWELNFQLGEYRAKKGMSRGR